MRTPLCDALGIRHPIVSAPMGPDLAGPELVAAVSEAGGLGVLQAQFAPPAELRAQIREIRARTAKPFGVSAILHFPAEPIVATCLEERVPVLWLFWGDPAPFVARAHAVGTKVFHQVGSVAEAASAARAGVDVVVAQGCEAGGHVRGDVSTLVLVPRVVDAIAPTPVIASGGIADARGLVAVLALGAQAGVLGTRFLASEESRAHPRYKQRLLEASEEDTALTTLFGVGWPNAPHRALRTPFVEARRGDEARGQVGRPDDPVVGRTVVAGRSVELREYVCFPPNREATGDVESMGMLAGQCVGAIDAIKPAGQLVREIAEEAERLERRLGRVPAP